MLYNGKAKREKILAEFERRIIANEPPPSMRDLARVAECSARVAQFHVEKLLVSGQLVRVGLPGAARSIVLNN